MTDTVFKPVSIGPGGWDVNITISNDGVSRIVRSDGSAFYYDVVSGRWQPSITALSVDPADVLPGGTGADGVGGAPGDNTRAYMMWRDGFWRSNDGARNWDKKRAGLLTSGNDEARSRIRIAIDDQNSNVAYFATRIEGIVYTLDGMNTFLTVPASAVPIGMQYAVKQTPPVSDFAKGITGAYPTEDTNNDGVIDLNDDSSGVSVAAPGISGIVVDQKSPIVNGRRSIIYAGSYGYGVYKGVVNNDNSMTWTKINPTGSIEGATVIKMSPNGDLFVISHVDPAFFKSYQPRLWRLRAGQTVWQDVTPPSNIYKTSSCRAVAADPNNPNRVVLATNPGDIFISLDGGTTWVATPYFTGASPGSPAWIGTCLINASGKIAAMTIGDILFDPVIRNRLWLVEGISIWYADLADSPTALLTWLGKGQGDEHLVGNDLIVPPGQNGRPLQGSYDRAIMRSESDDVFPLTYGPNTRFGSCWAMDWATADPNYIVASVCNHNDPHDIVRSGYSRDAGRTWSFWPTLPAAAAQTKSDGTPALDPVTGIQYQNGLQFGYGCVATTRPDHMIWIPASAKWPQVTSDGGQTWSNVMLPTCDTLGQYYDIFSGDGQSRPQRRVIAADRVTPNTYYIYHPGKGTFRGVVNNDNTMTWTLGGKAGPYTDYLVNAQFKSAPTDAGHLYICQGKLSGATAYVFRWSANGGQTWVTVPGITNVWTFGFGAKLTVGQTSDTLYAYGTINGVAGIYRTVNRGQDWVFLTDYPAGRMNSVKIIDGDKTVPGKVYALTGGAGMVVGKLGGTAQAGSDGSVASKVYLGQTKMAYAPPEVDALLASKVAYDQFHKVAPGDLPASAFGGVMDFADTAAMAAVNPGVVQIGWVARLTDGSRYMLGGDGDPSVLGNWKQISPPSTSALAGANVPVLPLLASVAVAGALTVQRTQLVDATAGSITMTALPALSGLDLGTAYGVSKTDSTTNTVTVPFAAGDTTSGGGVSASLLISGTITLQVVANPAGGKFWRSVNHVRSDTALDGRYASTLVPTPVKSGNYSAVVGDWVLVNPTGAYTVTLPTAPADKARVRVQLIASTNPVTIVTGGTDRFDVTTTGATSISLADAQQTTTFQYQASTGLWLRESNNLPLRSIRQTLPWSYSGSVAVRTGVGRIYLEDAATLVKIRASVGTAPTGSGLTVTVRQNGTSVGTVTIAAGTNTAVATLAVALAAGDYLTVDVTAVGSTTPGSDLVVGAQTQRA